MSEVYKPNALYNFEDSYYPNGTGLEEPGKICANFCSFRKWLYSLTTSNYSFSECGISVRVTSPAREGSSTAQHISCLRLAGTLVTRKAMLVLSLKGPGPRALGPRGQAEEMSPHIGSSLYLLCFHIEESLQSEQWIKIGCICVRQVKHTSAGWVNRWSKGFLHRFPSDIPFLSLISPLCSPSFLVCRMGTMIFT